MEKNFQAALAQTEIFEGKGLYSNDPYDPGGSTYGITQGAYTAWRAKKGLGFRGVRSISDQELSAIAKQQFWDPVRGDKLPAGLDLLLFDISFNSGPVKAVKFLQQALGVKIDGHFGLATQGALARRLLQLDGPREIIQDICAERLSFWKSLSTWWRFGKGWTRRGAGVEEKALALLQSEETPSLAPGLGKYTL